MSLEGRNSVIGAVILIAVLIAMLAIMNYYASGWDKAVGLDSSFLVTLIWFFVGAVILFAAICIGVTIFHKPPNYRRNPITLGNPLKKRRQI